MILPPVKFYRASPISLLPGLPAALRREVKARIEALPAEGFFKIARAVLADNVADTEPNLIGVVCIRVKAGGKLLSADATDCQSDVDDEVAARDVLVAAKLVERAGKGAGARPGVKACALSILA